MKKKTRIEVINETVEFYRENPNRRAFNTEIGQCAYFVEPKGKQVKHKMCAVGRLLKEPKKHENTEGPASDLINAEGYGVFKVDYQIRDPGFWDDLQRLHDRKKHWTKRGLSKKGKEYLNGLLETYKNK